MEYWLKSPPTHALVAAALGAKPQVPAGRGQDRVMSVEEFVATLGDSIG